MKLKTHVKSLNRDFVFDTDEFDRYFSDEDDALWIKELESGLVLEVSVFKDNDKISTDGYYLLWKSMGHFEDGDMYGTIDEGGLRFSKVD